jgi:crotonobetainyl-CoA:carnitine CoA-transferase CaiB-like acyl-CoA transferase
MCRGQFVKSALFESTALLLDVLLPTGKHAKIPGLPLEMGGHTPGVRLQPPRKGEHTRSILTEVRYSTNEVDALVAKGVAIDDTLA